MCHSITHEYVSSTTWKEAPRHVSLRFGRPAFHHYPRLQSRKPMPGTVSTGTSAALMAEVSAAPPRPPMSSLELEGGVGIFDS